MNLLPLLLLVALGPYQPPAAPREADWPRERLVQLMRDLAAEVCARHVVNDPRRAVFGMTYECWRDGRQCQVLGGQSMQDGAWLTEALCCAQRADPAGDYLRRARNGPLPFYLNLLSHSDQLFPDMRPNAEDPRPFERPLKGWVPRGWDDGQGYEPRTGQRLAAGHDTPSNQLACDLADMLLDAWLSTRDPALATAALELQGYRGACFGPLPTVDFAASFLAGLTHAADAQLPSCWPAGLGAYYTGLYEQRAVALPCHDDNLAWQYRRAVALYLQTGEFPQDFALHGLARCLAQQQVMEVCRDRTPYRYGLFGSDQAPPPTFGRGTGQLTVSEATGRWLYGGRGCQLSWLAAGLLPVLARQPALWQQTLARKAATDLVLPLVDALGEEPALRVPLAGTDSVDLVSDPRALHLLCEREPRRRYTLTFAPAEPVFDGPGEARVTLGGDEPASAVDAEGQPLECGETRGPGQRWSLRLPYSHNPGQRTWLNGVECGRYRLTLADRPPLLLVCASSPRRVLRRLEAGVLGTIATWEAIRRESGVLPGAVADPRSAAGGESASAAGTYAHLLKTIALWLLYRDGQSEWQAIAAQTPAQPLVTPPLPLTALQAQGLR